MTDYEVTDILAKVRDIIGMNLADTQLTADLQQDTLSLDDTIRESIVPAAQLIENAAPIEMLGEGVDAPTDSFGTVSEEAINTADTYRVIHGLAPTDFMRLVAFRMSDWSRSINAPISFVSPRYDMQRSRVVAVRGCPERPVLAMGITSATSGTTPRFEWEAYSSKTGSTVKTFAYIPQPSVKDDKISLCPLLLNAVVYATAYLTETALGDTNKASLFFATAKNLAGIADAPQQTTTQEEQ